MNIFATEVFGQGRRTHRFKILPRHDARVSHVRLAVVGATGYIGRNLQRHAESRHHHRHIELVPLSRGQLGLLSSGLDAGGRSAGGGEPSGELSRIRGSAALVNLAGSGRQSAQNPYEESVVGTAVSAVRVCKRAGIPRMVHLSGLGASARTPIAYLAAKYRAESAIRDSGLDYVVLRPSYVVGRGDHLTRYVTAVATGGRQGRPRGHGGTKRGGGEDSTDTASLRPPLPAQVVDVPGTKKDSRPIQPVHVCDAARVILWGATSGRAAGGSGGSGGRGLTLDLVGPDRITFYEYMRLLARAAGVRVRPVPMERAYRQALRAPSSAPFGVDDLGIIAGGFVGDYARLKRTTGIAPASVLRTLKAGGLP